MAAFEEIRNEAREISGNARGSHDWEHTERVLRLAVRIGREEGADLEIVRYAALLHDIARGEEDASNGRICHARRGAEMARELLLRRGFDQDRIDKIAHCIETHRYRGGKPPLTVEARALFDADKLDAIGAVGIGRAFLFAGEVGARLHRRDIDVDRTEPYTEDDTAYREYLVKLKDIKSKIMTGEGKRIAESRHRFMESFFDRLNREVEGDL